MNGSILVTVDTKPLLDAIASVESHMRQMRPAVPATIPGVVVGLAAAATASTRKVTRRGLLGLSFLSRKAGSQ